MFCFPFIVQLCVLGNLCPETVEEAIAMVPSIKVYFAFPENSFPSLSQSMLLALLLHLCVHKLASG